MQGLSKKSLVSEQARALDSLQRHASTILKNALGIDIKPDEFTQIYLRLEPQQFKESTSATSYFWELAEGKVDVSSATRCLIWRTFGDVSKAPSGWKIKDIYQLIILILNGSLVPKLSQVIGETGTTANRQTYPKESGRGPRSKEVPQHVVRITELETGSQKRKRVVLDASSSGEEENSHSTKRKARNDGKNASAESPSLNPTTAPNDNSSETNSVRSTNTLSHPDSPDPEARPNSPQQTIVVANSKTRRQSVSSRVIATLETCEKRMTEYVNLKEDLGRHIKHLSRLNSEMKELVVKSHPDDTKMKLRNKTQDPSPQAGYGELLKRVNSMEKVIAKVSKLV
ncbi:hypothetical protein ABW19_dt0204417 [Dactylella cylindrospora]|nr:hypothetical protein ABW19_dt0204417 [Dactylella cylindrospora]